MLLPRGKPARAATAGAGGQEFTPQWGGILFGLRFADTLIRHVPGVQRWREWCCPGYCTYQIHPRLDNQLSYLETTGRLPQTVRSASTQSDYEICLHLVRVYFLIRQCFLIKVCPRHEPPPKFDCSHFFVRNITQFAPHTALMLIS